MTRVRCCAAAKAVCWWEHPHVGWAGAAISSPTWLNLCRRPLFSPGRPHPSLKTWKHLQALLHHRANVLLLPLYPIHRNCESAQKVHACMGLNLKPFGLSGLIPILWLIPVGFGSIPMAVNTSYAILTV